jgi:fused signal recognition particle receptor
MSFFSRLFRRPSDPVPVVEETSSEGHGASPSEVVADAAVSLDGEVSLALHSIKEEKNTSLTLSEPEPKSVSLTWRERLKAGLKKTRDRLGKSLKTLLHGKVLDEALLEELEALLLTADVGVQATQALIEALQARYKAAGEGADAHILLQQCLLELLQPLEAPLDTTTHTPFVIMLAGVNGAGKTTSIGKLAHYFQTQGQSVLLAAGDTFRAAAREQLAAWGERNGVTVISQASADPAAVIFDAIQAAKARKIDIVLADTAGRLGTQQHLMEELKKIKRVVQKAEPTAPHEVLLVLDANTGQNALNQLQVFDEAIGVTGLVMTKLDGSAKGGVMAAIAKSMPKPIRFIGVGESQEDLRPFEAQAFIDALFEEEGSSGVEL